MKHVHSYIGTQNMSGMFIQLLNNGQIVCCELQNSERKTIEQFIMTMESIIGLWGDAPLLFLFDFRNSDLTFSPFFAHSLKSLPQIEYGRQAILVAGEAERKQMAFFPHFFAPLDYQFFQNYDLALSWLEEAL